MQCPNCGYFPDSPDYGSDICTDCGVDMPKSQARREHIAAKLYGRCRCNRNADIDCDYCSVYYAPESELDVLEQREKVSQQDENKA